MSKPIRIRGFVADPVAVLAEAENRSFANMVEVLLLAALDGRKHEALVRIAGTPTKSSGEEAKDMAREAMAALTERENGGAATAHDGKRVEVDAGRDRVDESVPVATARSVSAAVTPNDQNDGVDFVPPSTRTLPADKVMASFDRSARSRPHMKLHRPAVECPTRWPSGVCPDCGTVVT